MEEVDVDAVDSGADESSEGGGELLPDEVRVSRHPHVLRRFDNGSGSWYCDDQCDHCTRAIEGPTVRWSCRECGYDLCRGCAEFWLESLPAEPEGGGGAAGSDARPAGGSEGAGGEELAHSVHVVLPEGFEGIPIDIIFDDATQARIFDTCRRSIGHDVFRRLWPARGDFLEAMRRGLEEAGRGTVAHGLSMRQAQALVARLTEFVAAEIGVDREAAALAAARAGSGGGGGGGGVGVGAEAGAGAPAGAEAGSSEADANARIHSVHFVLPNDMQDMLDVILPEILPRMVDVCRRHREFATSWPSGPSEMERALRQSVAQSGQGPLLHGMRRAQAEAVRDHLAELFTVEVVVDREAAARIQERERRSRPPPRPPPMALLARLPPGAQVRVGGGVVSSSMEELQRGFGGVNEEARRCVGAEGTVAGYTPAEGSGSWAVRVLCKLDSGTCSHSWNPALIEVFRPCEPEGARPDGVVAKPAEERAASKPADMAGKKEQCAEVLLASNEDLLVGDAVISHSDSVWQAGRITALGGEDGLCSVEMVDGRVDDSILRRHVHAVVALEASPEPLAVGTVVQITSNLEKAKSLQRGRWNDELEKCLGQRGVVEELRDHHRVVVNCPAVSAATTWATPCLRQDNSKGLLCLDLHEHPLWWCSRLARPGTCTACGATDVEQGYCCLRSGSDQCVVCSSCAAPYAAVDASVQVHTRHHLWPLSRVHLPRGLKHIKWRCAGELMPGGCRGARSAAEEGSESSRTPGPVTGAACCAEDEFTLCDACLVDESLGEATQETRRIDLAALPASAPRIAVALRRHPSEVFALAEAGLFAALAGSLGSDQAARGLAFDLGAWLAAPPPSRAEVGPALVDTGDGIWAEAHVVAEDADDFDGTWTDEKEPGRWMRAIEGSTIHPPVAGSEAKADLVVEVSGCGMPGFNGQYVPDGTKNGRVRFRKVGGALQTCNYSDGSWYLCHNHSGSWYESASDSAHPPSGGWVVGERGQVPPPTVMCRSCGTEAMVRPFPLLPSVGTWLQRRADVGLPASQASAPSSSSASTSGEPSRRGLDGVWLREASGDHITLEAGRLIWPDGGSSMLGPVTVDGGLKIDIRGQALTGRLDETGSRLLWSDGDIWTRAQVSSVRQLEPTPEVGQPVKFRGFAGCTIKQVLSRRKVLIHIPGVGDQEASSGEYSLRDPRGLLGVDGGCGPEGTQLAKLQRLSKDTFCMELGGMVQCAQLTADGRLVWADGGNTWINIVHCPRCPMGHLLRRARHTTPWHCKDCSERLGERQRLRCSSCDYDVCDTCVAVNSWEQATSASSSGMEFNQGEEVEVCRAGIGSDGQWARCRVEGDGDAKGSYRVRLISGDASAAGDSDPTELEVPVGKLRRCDWASKTGPVDALWRYASPTNNPIGIRAVPKIDGPRDGQMRHGQVFRVSEHRKGADGVMFLRLADGRGWVFDKKPGVGMMCVLLRAREAQKRKTHEAGCWVAHANHAVALEEMVAVASTDQQSAAGALAEAEAASPSGLPPPTHVPLGRLRPAFPAGRVRTCSGDFLRAELLRELGRGPLCEKGRVQGLLEGRANLLGVEGGENPLSVALKTGCKAGVLESLLVAHAPLTSNRGAEKPLPSAAGGGGSSSSAAPSPRREELAEGPLRALLAEPRLAALLADRGGSVARLAAAAMLSAAAGSEAQAEHGGPAAASSCARGDVNLVAARCCAAAAGRLAETPRPRGCMSELLRQFGAELLTPLLEAGKNEVLEPGGPLGGLLRALAVSGYELSPAQADRIASVVSVQLALDRDEAICSLLSFVRLVLDSFRGASGDDETPGGTGSNSSLRCLCSALRRHGIAAAMEQLADPSASPWLESVDLDQDAIWSTVVDIAACLREVELPQLSPDSEVSAVVERLPEREALEELVEMLSRGVCTPYELGVLKCPERILPMFEAPAKSWPWPPEPPVGEASALALASKLQVLLGISETFPVWGVGVQGEGLDCLLRPHSLVLEGAAGRRELRVEPLLPLGDLERFVLCSAPLTEESYLEWCRTLCGKRIAEHPLPPSGSACPAVVEWQAAVVLKFGSEQGLPVHSVRYEADGREAQLLLHLRRVVVLGPAGDQPSCVGSGSTGSQTPPPEQGAPSSSSYGPGSQVQARFRDGTWCRATVESDAGDGMFRIRWENGTQTDTTKKVDDLRPLPGTGKRTCQRVLVTRDDGTVSGIAVWEHASGAQDVIDQEGCFLSTVPRGSVVPEARHARDSSGRPVPFEARSLSVPEHERAPPAPSLERTFSAVDRDYRPRDFQYRNPARKIGGLDGEPLQGPGRRQGATPELSPRQESLLEEVASGKPAPRLRVLFRRTPPPGTTQTTSAEKCVECRSPERASAPASSSSVNPASNPASPEKTEANSPQPDEEEWGAPLQPLSPTSTVLQALLHTAVGGCVDLPDSLRLWYEVQMGTIAQEHDQALPSLPSCSDASQIGKVGASRDGDSDANGIVAPALRLLRCLRRCLPRSAVPPQDIAGLCLIPGISGEPEENSWECGPLNRKLMDQLAQPLLTAAVAAPAWVSSLPLAYPFLFEREAREQLLRLLGFGTSHAVLWMQRRSIEERYGDRLRRAEGLPLEGRMDLTEHIVSDHEVFIGPARSDLVTLPSRSAGLLHDAELVVELTYASKATLEVKFADEGGFGDGVTQSFYTTVASELIALGDGDAVGAAPLASSPLCGAYGLWTEHLPSSVTEYRGRSYLHSRRGLFPRPLPPGSESSELACQKLRILGRLMAKALRDGFTVPLPLSGHFFAAVLGEDLPLEALPSPGDGCVGEFVGAAASFAADLRCRHAGLSDDALAAARLEAGAKPDWGQEFLGLKEGEAMAWSFDQYVSSCCIVFCESGLGGPELCEGGSGRTLDVHCLEEFVELAARWWLRDGIAAQVAAFRAGVEDVCASSTVWAFEADELASLFCGGHTEWTREELTQHLRPRAGFGAAELKQLAEVLERMTPARRGRFLEFVTACPRLPPGGLSAAEISVAPANPPGSLPRARTCTKELRLPAYDSVAQMEERLNWAIDNAEGLYDDDRMG